MALILLDVSTTIREDFSCHKIKFQLASMVALSSLIQITNWHWAEVQTKYFVFIILKESNAKTAFKGAYLQ